MPKLSLEGEIRSRMKRLGIYKKEFENSIKRYIEISNEYNIIYRRYSDSGFECSEHTANGSKKAPIVTTLEVLRRDMLALENALGLTPQGLLKLDENAFIKPKKASNSSGWKAGLK